MYNPPHPGEFISSTYLVPFNIGLEKLASHLNESQETVSDLLAGKSDITAELALKLSAVLGRTPESWLNMQRSYDLWLAKKQVDTTKLQPLINAGDNFDELYSSVTSEASRRAADSLFSASDEEVNAAYKSGKTEGEVLSKAIQNLKNELSLSDDELNQMTGNDKTHEIVLIDIYRSLYSRFGGNTEAINHWLNTMNLDFDKQRPIEVIKKKNGAEVLKHLVSAR